MKHVIIGTAGHVDHGKTLLVRALTGIDTDRLKEEKKRGITIELGFAHIEFENGMQAGIVDVPGHETFIKNMLMGAGGVDFAMLVVAADEGFMPQTIEHLEILSLLGLQNGLVVITKSDIVEEDFLEMVKEDVAQHVKGTFLEGKEVVCVSAYTGRGIPELRKMLGQLTADSTEKNIHAPFRLPVDRVFSVDGFGTVVTGTLTDGQINEGEEAILYPSGLSTRVRNIQVHNSDTPRAYAGQRVAINLAGLKREQVERGSVVAFPSSVQCPLMLDVKLSLLPNCNRRVKSGGLLHLYHGSAALLCKAVLLDREELGAGEACFAQLRLTENVAVREGDRFVVRFYSPMETIGGGVILDTDPQRHKRNDAQLLRQLALRESGSDRDRVLCAVRDGAATFKPWSEAKKPLTLSKEVWELELAALKTAGEILEYGESYYIDYSTIKDVSKRLQRLLTDYHKANPLSAGLKREEVRQKLFGRLEPSLCDGILAIIMEDGEVHLVEGLLSLSEFQVNYSDRHQKILTQLQKLFKDGALAPPAVEDAYLLFPKDKEGCKQVLTAMLADEKLIQLTPQIVLHRDSYGLALSQLMKHFEGNESISLPEMRDILATSRKYALALLEYWDRIKLTRMQGDARILIKRQ